jgi:hypothetical protein
MALFTANVFPVLFRAHAQAVHFLDALNAVKGAAEPDIPQALLAKNASRKSFHWAAVWKMHL